MPRPKTRDHDLPACVYRKHSSIWLVKSGKWIRLGATVPEALRAYAVAIVGNTVRTTAPDMMPALLYRWLDDKTIADQTRKTYGVAVRQLAEIFAEFRPDQVTAREITAVMHHHRNHASMANHMRSVLIGALDYAYLENRVERNVARDTRPLKTTKRGRYLAHGELTAIRTAASPTMRAVIDLLYLTGQRIGDILALKHSHIDDAGLHFRQQKTGNRLVIEWSPELHAAVDAARALHQSVRGMTLIHTRRGEPMSYSTIRTMWDRATAAAGIDDAHLHDIRAKTATDAKQGGQDSKTLLGHTTESSHLRYLRSREIPVAEPLRIRQR